MIFPYSDPSSMKGWYMGLSRMEGDWGAEMRDANPTAAQPATLFLSFRKLRG